MPGKKKTKSKTPENVLANQDAYLERQSESKINRRQYLIPDRDHPMMEDKAKQLRADYREEFSIAHQEQTKKEQQTCGTIKRCDYCGEKKAVSFFRKSRSTKDGYTDTCKPCRYRERNRLIEPIKNRSKPKPKPKPKPKSKPKSKPVRDRSKTNKRCAFCNTTKPVASFSRNDNCKDGYLYKCKACTNQHNTDKRTVKHFKEYKGQ